MATYENVIAQVQTYIQAASATLGIRAAPAEPPSKAMQFPFVISYAPTGRWKHTPVGSKTGLGSVIIDVHVSRRILQRDWDKLMDMVETIPNLLFLKFKDDNKWNGKVDTIGDITWEWVAAEYAGLPTYVMRFTVEGVKAISAVV